MKKIFYLVCFILYINISYGQNKIDSISHIDLKLKNINIPTIEPIKCNCLSADQYIATGLYMTSLVFIAANQNNAYKKDNAKELLFINLGTFAVVTIAYFTYLNKK